MRILGIAAFAVCSLLWAQTSFDPLTWRPPVTFLDPRPEKAGLELFVSTNGDDAKSGRTENIQGEDGPFATLERARDEVRRLKKAGGVPGGITITLGEGVYRRSASFQLNAEDAGTATSPVVYRAKPGSVVRILGGRKMNAADFQPVAEPAFRSRLDDSAKDRVVQLRLADFQLGHGGPFPPVFSDNGGLFEIFVDGTRLPLSRWPDQGSTTMKEVLTNGEKNLPGVFLARDERMAKWNVEAGVWLKGQWRVGWEDPAIKVASIDPATLRVNFAVGIGGGIGNKYKRPRGSGEEPFHALNVLEEITRPGEWCIDFRSQTLFLWPPAGFATGDILVSQLETPLIQATNLAHVSFIGLTLEGSLGDGFQLSRCDSVLVAGCTIRNLGGRGVVLDGERSGVVSCDVHGVGKGCLVISGGDRKNLVPSGTYAVNNHLHHYGVLRGQYSAAIDLYSDSKGLPAVGIYAAHNLIHHAPRDAVLYAGQMNLFEFNEIHRCGYDTADTGSFYSWSDWTIRRFVIRHNYLHDAVGGVNPDDGASGATVVGNLFKGERSGAWIASGPDNVFWGNLFLKPEGPVFGLDDRGLGRGYSNNARMWNAVKAVQPDQEPWKSAFPEMAGIREDSPWLPMRSRFSSNAIWIGKGNPIRNALSKPTAKNPDILEFDGNWTTDEDPGFVDFAAGDLRLRNDAKVFREIPGFPPLPFEKMGLFIDRWRTRLPTPVEAGRLPEQDPWKAGDTNRNFGT